MCEESKKDSEIKVRLVKVNDLKAEGSTDSCLRPLGLCDLGGCCDICWYGPKSKQSTKKPV